MERHDSLAPIKEIKKEEPQIIVEKQKEKEVIIEDKKSIDEIAREVMNGEWGYGKIRTNKIKAAGYNMADIQNKIREINEEKNKKE